MTDPNKDSKYLSEEDKSSEPPYQKIQMTWEELQSAIRWTKSFDKALRKIQDGSNTVGVVLYIAFHFDEDMNIDPYGKKVDFLPVPASSIDQDGKVELFNRYKNSFETVDLKKRCRNNKEQKREE